MKRLRRGRLVVGLVLLAVTALLVAPLGGGRASADGSTDGSDQSAFDPYLSSTPNNCPTVS